MGALGKRLDYNNFIVKNYMFKS